MSRLVALLLAMCAFAEAPVFVCPMDPEVRSATAGQCPRCGMQLVSSLPEPMEYPMEFRVEPKQIPAGRDIAMSFRILDPVSQMPVRNFSVVHEKLFHLFLVSQDLEYFSHEHPSLRPDGWFRLQTRLPKPGTYRLLADFDPAGGTPQLSARTFSTAGYTASLETSIPKLSPDLSAKEGGNLQVEMRTEPVFPMPGRKTMLFVSLRPAEGIEKYLGAWAHLLAVSDDLIDTIHTHPFVADGGGEMQFNIYFSRARTYRVWLQIQRSGTLNTVAFTVPVKAL